MNDANSSGVLLTGSRPWASRNLRISGSATILRSASFRVSTIGFGTPADDTSPNQVVMS